MGKQQSRLFKVPLWGAADAVDAVRDLGFPRFASAAADQGPDGISPARPLDLALQVNVQTGHGHKFEAVPRFGGIALHDF